MPKMAILGGFRLFGKLQKNCLITFFSFSALIKPILVPNTSSNLNGLESFIQILQHFEIFHIMGPYGGKNFKRL